MANWPDMIAPLTRFATEEEGVVTVDWVVLSAVVIGLGLIMVETIGGGTNSMALNVADRLDTVTSGYSN